MICRHHERDAQNLAFNLDFAAIWLKTVAASHLTQLPPLHGLPLPYWRFFGCYPLSFPMELVATYLMLPGTNPYNAATPFETPR